MGKFNLNWNEQRVMHFFFYEAADLPVSSPRNSGLQYNSLSSSKAFHAKMKTHEIINTLAELERKGALHNTGIDSPPPRYAMHEADEEEIEKAIFSYHLKHRVSLLASKAPSNL
jgi:hypothetical protein